MEKEISETYSFRPLDFDEKGRRIVDGLSFRDVVKEYERDFHYRHSTEYALNLYANSKTMALLAKSNDHGVGSGVHFFVINLAVSEFVCKFAIVKQYSWKIYGQTDTEEKRNRYLHSAYSTHIV